MIDRIELPRKGSAVICVSPFSGIVLAAVVCAVGLVDPARLSAQTSAGPDTAVIDTIRVQTQISESDQRRIGDWIEAQVAAVRSAPESGQPQRLIELRELLRAQFEHSGNTPAFKEQFAARAASVFVAQLQSGADPVTVRGLAKILIDFNRIEALPAYLAGLKSADAGVRMLSAAGIAALRAPLATDKTRLDSAVAGLREAGLAETQGVALDRMYWALSMPAAQAAAVVDAFLAIFDKRIERKRAGALACDGAEVSAFEFFRTPAVLSALAQPQKEKLVRTAGEFMRFDAHRYVTPNLDFTEIDRIQRQLDATEEIVAAVVGSGVKGGDVRGAIAAGLSPAEVRQQVYLWVGNPESKQPGALNATPWNLPIESP